MDKKKKKPSHVKPKSNELELKRKWWNAQNGYKSWENQNTNLNS